MRRIGLVVVLAISLTLAPLAARAQQTETAYRIGVLTNVRPTTPEVSRNWEALINDAPSLHTAEVGISVANAVDVAKDAADIILRERNLDVLHRGLSRAAEPSPMSRSTC